jgi:hypothetical protein
MQRFYQWNRVAHTIKEIRVAERDVLRTGGDLLANIREHNFAINDAKDAFVHRHNGAMAAKMLATAAGFGVTRDAMLAVGQNQMCVGSEWR